jgi:hypothetical protein
MIIQVTEISTAITPMCTSTSTSTTIGASGNSGAMTCSVTVSSYTFRSITCANTPATSSATKAVLRIEDNDNERTIDEGCIVSGLRVIALLSGGMGHCDRTKNGANPIPGATLTTQIEEAARQYGFDYDGTWSRQSDNYYESLIGQSTGVNQQSVRGVLINEQLTLGGGSETQSRNGRSSRIWAFDAFNANAFLVMSISDVPR